MTAATRIDRDRSALYAEIEGALGQPNPPQVNLQVPKHAVIGPVLRRIAFAAKYAGRAVPVVFTDGSRPPPFPAGQLAVSDEIAAEEKEELLKRANSVLKLGVMSMRHPELDYLVDLYVTRNTELSREDDSAADKEALSYDRTVRTLSDPAIVNGGEIWVYQTGFEPMIVGFYRGVNEILKRRRSARNQLLVVRPWLFCHSPKRDYARDSVDKDDSGDNPSYSPTSPGAQPQSYDPVLPWY